MSEYRITCVNKAVTTASHPHVMRVGLELSSGAPGVRVLTVAEVAAGIDAGDMFYTERAGMRAVVSKYTCRDCGIETLRSQVRGRWNYDLDNLSPCPR
jgi:hypothetical protein